MRKFDMKTHNVSWISLWKSTIHRNPVGKRLMRKKFYGCKKKSRLCFMGMGEGRGILTLKKMT